MKKHIASIEGEAFNRLIAGTEKFVCRDARMPVLQYIVLQFSEDAQRVCATTADGFRFSREYASCEVERDFTAFFMPRIRVPKTICEVYSDEGDVIIRSAGGLVFGFRQPSYPLFNMEKINETLNKPVILTTAANATFLIEALQCARAVNNGTHKRHVYMDFRGPLEPVVIRTGKENIKMVVPIRIYGEED